MTSTDATKLRYGQLLDNPYIRRRFDSCFLMLAPYLANQKQVSILDIGGYTGDFYYYLIKKCRVQKETLDYLILDQDKRALRIAKNRGIKTKLTNFDTCDWSIPGTKNKFDIIICTEVLEHLVDPAATMTLIKKAVKQNGVILISLPNENTFYHRLLSLSGHGVDQLAFKRFKHLHLPTIKQSRDFISSYFQIIETRYYEDYNIKKNSELGFLPKLIQRIPKQFTEILRDGLPALFARGSIYLSKPKD